MTKRAEEHKWLVAKEKFLKELRKRGVSEFTLPLTSNTLFENKIVAHDPKWEATFEIHLS